MSPLAAEFSVSPLDARVAYKPSARLHVPVMKWMAVTPYVGTAVDASYLGTLLVKGYEFQKERDFYDSLRRCISLGGVVLGLGVLGCGVGSDGVVICGGDFAWVVLGRWSRDGRVEILTYPLSTTCISGERNLPLPLISKRV